MNRLRCAAYLRISTSMQNPLSPDDQLRKCREFATREGWDVLDDQIYADEALSGVGSDRPGLTRMMEAAVSQRVRSTSSSSMIPAAFPEASATQCGYSSV